MKNEIAAAAGTTGHNQHKRHQPLQTLYFGGGTPTILPMDTLLDLIGHVRRHFRLADGYEWTMEANPGAVQPGRLQLLRQAGINRLSFGLQVMQPHLLRLLGRIHTYADLQNSVAMAQEAGFTNISVDLLIGLPQQTLADIRETVRAVLSLPVAHVSYYSLTLEEGTPLAAACAAGRYALPEDELERSQYDLVRGMLAEAGLEQYEISNSARPGFACRHNLTYWHALPYLGFGAAAHRYVDGVRSSNAADLDAYMAAWLADRPQKGCCTETGDDHGAYGDPGRVSEAQRINRDEAMREMMLLGLRLIQGVDHASFCNRFGFTMQSVFAAELALLESRGLIVCGTQGVCLSPLGLDLANQVFLAFIP